jgi:hypothetical protein
MPSDGTPEPELNRRDLYDLADAIAVDLAVEEPDWCRIADEAARLARQLQDRCQTSRGG